MLSFVLSVLATHLVRRWALRRDFVDKPGGHKTHEIPVALGGGIAIFWLTTLPLIVVMVLAAVFQKTAVPDFVPDVLARHIPGLISRSRLLGSLVGAAVVLHIIGLFDDLRPLGPRIKLLGQFFAAGLLAVVGEIRFDFFIQSDIIATLLSVLWMVIIINAFNFLDNMDGLSGGVAVISAGMILGAALASDQVFVGAQLAIFIGVLCGFLVFNFAPAKIYMGDAGSLLVGLHLAVATIRTTYYQQTSPADGGSWYNTLMPLIVLAVPLYDFASVVIIRLLQGRSPFVGDNQHFSHRLVARGMTRPQAVLTIYLATACCGLGATVLHQVSSLGVILIFLQTLMILAIIAILERPLIDSQ